MTAHKIPTVETIREILTDMDGTKHKFNMSGYDGNISGSCTEHNNAILMRFAKFGLFDYTDFLALDFYKGSVRVYLKYFNGDYYEDEEDLNGWTTSEIIHELFKLTIGSGKHARRRD